MLNSSTIFFMIYIGNVFFELELENRVGTDLFKAFEKNPYFLQLQFLPLLFLSENDTLLVTKMPTQGYLEILMSILVLPKISLISDFSSLDKTAILRSWGSSKLISSWAFQKNINYEMPAMDCSKKVNSKLWNFTQHSPLKNAKIVYSANCLEEAIKTFSIKWVLKTDQGFAGRGHFVFTKAELSKAIVFAKKEWNQGKGVILEPWVERVLDFSSQWYITKEGTVELIGLTKCLNTLSGVYLGTEAGDNETIFQEWVPFVIDHVAYCRTYLKAFIEEGFYGNLGVDAMVYKDVNTGSPNLYPILEVNARMTMSCAVLLFHQRYRKEKVTRIYYGYDDSNRVSLLPEGYQRKLIIEN